MRRRGLLLLLLAAGCSAEAVTDAGPDDPDAAPGNVETFLEGKPTNPTREKTASFRFSSSVTTATFECALDKPYSFAACTSPRELVALADGRHDFAVRARTAAGAVDASPAEWSWTVNTMGPEVTLVGPGEGSISGRSVTFTYTTEANAPFSCAIDSTTLLDCGAAGKTYTLLTGGEHKFRIRATDAAGNQGPTVTRTWTVDAVGPMVTFTPFANDESGSDGTVKLMASESATFSCKLDGGAFALCPPAGYAFADLAAGEHTLVVRATDLQGNTGNDASYTWTVVGDAEVLVTHQGAPVVGATVVFHDALGNVLGSATTDVAGRATGEVPIGGMVTGAYQKDGVFYLTTVSGAQPFETVVAGRPRIAAAGTVAIQTSLPPAPAGSSELRQDFGDDFAFAGPPVTSISRMVGESARDSGGKWNELCAMVNAAGTPIAYGWATGITAQATVPAWLGAISRSVTVSAVPAGTTALDAEAGILFHGLGYRDGAFVTIADPPASPPLTFMAPPAGVGEGSWVNARIQRLQGEQKIVTTAATVDFGTALPFVTGLGLDRSMSSRPRAQWTSPSGFSAADGVLTVIVWGDGGGDPDPKHVWQLVSPPVGSVQSPALPESLASYRPRIQNVLAIVRHLSVENNAWDGAGWRAGWLEVAGEGLPQTDQRSPVVFGTTFTTRMTDTSP